MGYNDYFGYVDIKNFETMAKEYAKNSRASVNILQNSKLNREEFLKAYEDFLTILIMHYKEIEQDFVSDFGDFLGGKKAELKGIISKFCELYKEIKCDYFFTPFACKIETNFDIKNEVKNRLEKVIFLASKCLQNSQQKLLINLSFSLIKIL